MGAISGLGSNVTAGMSLRRWVSRGESVDAGLGPGLPPVDAVVVAARADLRPLRREGGVHGGGQRGVQAEREAAQFGVWGVPGLSLAELGLGLARRGEKLCSPGRGRHVGLVPLLRLAAGLVTAARDPRSHAP